jgi:nuclear pore complex protein Nup62
VINKKIMQVCFHHLIPILPNSLLLSASGLGALSTSTVQTANISVPPPSMLRGKTIEEIVNRWSTELETHVRDFNKFAGEVAVWDRALIENGNNVCLV